MMVSLLMHICVTWLQWVNHNEMYIMCISWDGLYDLQLTFPCLSYKDNLISIIHQAWPSRYKILHIPKQYMIIANICHYPTNMKVIQTTLLKSNLISILLLGWALGTNKIYLFRNQFECAPSQWETILQCTISHWLSACRERPLLLVLKWQCLYYIMNYICGIIRTTNE